jgi:hypothetical protein
MEPKYWVEAQKAVKDSTKVIGYGVWHFNEHGGRERVELFRVTRKGGYGVALYLANTLRDDLNAAEESKSAEFVYDPDKMFPFASKHRMTD